MLQLYLVVHGRAQLQHSSHFVTLLRSVLRLHANTSSPDLYWRKWPNRQAHLELCYSKPDILKRVPNQIVLSNSIAGEVHTYASYKTTRTWENFNNKGTKIFLLSDQLWLIANNFKSFANMSKSLIKNNLGLCKQF